MVIVQTGDSGRVVGVFTQMELAVASMRATYSQTPNVEFRQIATGMEGRQSWSVLQNGVEIDGFWMEMHNVLNTVDHF